MGVITTIAFGILAIAFFVEMFWKVKDWLQGRDATSKGKEIPSPPAYPVLKHLPYLWNDSDLPKRLLQWAKMFENEGILQFDPLLGECVIW